MVYLYKVFKTIDWLVEKLAVVGLVIAVISMLLLTLMVIFMRWLDTTYMWVDPLVRHLVFLCAFLGGVLAVGNKEHIGIDLIGKFLEQKNCHKIKNTLEKIIYLACSLTCVWVIFGAIRFVQDAYEFESQDVFLGISTGALVTIIPLGFALMSYRFFFQFIHSLFAGFSWIEWKKK